MKKIYKLLTIFSILLIAGCDMVEVKDEANISQITISVRNLIPAADSLEYVLWLSYVDIDRTVYRFVSQLQPSANGSLDISLDASFTNLHTAQKVVVSLEKTALMDSVKPKGPSILAGTFQGNDAPVTLNSAAGDFTESTAKYSLSTPTDGAGVNETSGIWFVDSLGRTGGPIAGLKLPTLSTGWKYFAWVETGAEKLPVGAFTSITSADDRADYSDTQAPGYSAPGEDFLLNAPSGVSFPLDLKGLKVYITLQPSVKTEVEPFFVRVFEATIPSDAVSGPSYNMTKNTVIPSGTAKIKLDI
ncbi:MAG: hypothetical protein K9I69_02390 [Ignavibacteriales bacterium]|nr:hypothetical protein [Ignavibacteriales bacterium]MCF8306934.1 hypothetical protein [Ignavibacteriales bacterium]MCF8437374.1 hypothetical protein [Ignavibacteriales bacterium]